MVNKNRVVFVDSLPNLLLLNLKTENLIFTDDTNPKIPETKEQKSLLIFILLMHTLRNRKKMPMEILLN
jgi:hypothetical protein